MHHDCLKCKIKWTSLHRIYSSKTIAKKLHYYANGIHIVIQHFFIFICDVWNTVEHKPDWVWYMNILKAISLSLKFKLREKSHIGVESGDTTNHDENTELTDEFNRRGE